jgi:hypothetical protein
LSVGLREQIITPHEVINLVNGIAAEWDLQRTEAPSPAPMGIDPCSTADPKIAYTQQPMLDVQYHSLPVSAVQRTGLSPEPGMDSSPHPTPIRESSSDLQDPVRVQSSTLPSLKVHISDSTEELDSDLSSLSDLDSDEYASDKFNSDSDCDEPNSDEEVYHGEDETELESEVQEDSTEPVQVPTQDEELEDEDNTMNTELKALLEGTTEDADLEAKVGALGSNTDVLDLDIIPPQGVDGDDDEDVQYIPPETNQAPRTPEPDEEFSDKGGLGFQEICDQHLYVPFSFKNCADISY